MYLTTCFTYYTPLFPIHYRWLLFIIPKIISCENDLIAHERAGQSTCTLHALPLHTALRAVFGKRRVKWLTEIRVE